MQNMITAVSDSREVHMQDLKIYIVIQDPNTRQDVSIKGNFEVLRAFLSGVGNFEIQDPAPMSSPIIETKSTTDKRKSPKREGIAMTA
jgi:hypothetical protein